MRFPRLLREIQANQLVPRPTQQRMQQQRPFRSKTQSWVPQSPAKIWQSMLRLLPRGGQPTLYWIWNSSLFERI